MAFPRLEPDRVSPVVDTAEMLDRSNRRRRPLIDVELGAEMHFVVALSRNLLEARQQELKVREGHGDISLVLVLHDEVRHREETKEIGWRQIPSRNRVLRAIEKTDRLCGDPHAEDKRDGTGASESVVPEVSQQCLGTDRAPKAPGSGYADERT